MTTLTQPQPIARGPEVTSVVLASAAVALLVVNPLLGGLAGLAALAFALANLIRRVGRRGWLLTATGLAGLTVVAGAVYLLTSVPVTHETRIDTTLNQDFYGPDATG